MLSLKTPEKEHGCPLPDKSWPGWDRGGGGGGQSWVGPLQIGSLGMDQSYFSRPLRRPEKDQTTQRHSAFNYFSPKANISFCLLGLEILLKKGNCLAAHRAKPWK